ncbi:cytochrome P450, partial [Piptocephalis cylindrospora]
GRLAHIFFGENILFSNGHDWQFFRRTCTPAFKHGWNLQVFEQTIQRLIDQWNKLGSEPISVGPWFERYALDSLGLSIFTTEFGSILDANSPFAVLYRTIMENILRFKYLLFNKLDFRANPYRKPIYDMVDDFDRLFYGLIQERREAKARGDVLPRDLLTSFLEEHKSVDEAGAKILRVMTDKELRDNLSAFILAGHDTAMVSLSTAMYLLGMDQSVQSKARQAVLEAIGGSEGAETLMHIPYLDAVIRETLRLYPPAARLMERTTTKDVMMPSGDLLPKGTHVIGNLYAIHRDPAVWGEDVEEYKPERHLTPDGQEMTSASSNSFVAFASGPRTCLGMTFAMAEMRVALARL